MFEAWKNAIPGGKYLKNTSVICDLHFPSDHIIREYSSAPVEEHLRIPSIKIQLKDGSIPSIFPPKVKTEKSVINVISPPQGCENFEEECDFKKISKHVDCIPLPSKCWSVKNFSNMIVWNSWSEDAEDIRHEVILKEDKTMKVL